MKRLISTNSAPKAIGPYAQGNIYQNLVFTSGQIPIDPQSGEIPEGIAAQAKQALNNLKAVLEAGGSSMDKVLKTTVFINDMNDFATVNEIYATFFKEGSYPSRSAVEVSKLPKNVLIEIEAIAYI